MLRGSVEGREGVLYEGAVHQQPPVCAHIRRHTIVQSTMLDVRSVPKDFSICALHALATLSCDPLAHSLRQRSLPLTSQSVNP